MKALYGLPQANYISYHGLKDHLATEDLHETTTKCHFRHISKDISFIVNVDDFLFKIKSVEDILYFALKHANRSVSYKSILIILSIRICVRICVMYYVYFYIFQPYTQVLIARSFKILFGRWRVSLLAV